MSATSRAAGVAAQEPAPSAVRAGRPDAELPELLEGRYRVRFARTAADLEACQRLRFEVFNVELAEGLPGSWEDGRDRDEFDPACAHLMVEDGEGGGLLGTYRLQTAEAALAGRGFYAAREFDLAGLPPEVIAGSAELGRACVARGHRTGHVLFALWRGLAAFAAWKRRRYLFGCASLTGTDPALGAEAYGALRRRGLVSCRWGVEPRPAFACAAPAPEAGENPAEVAFPRLFATYLRYGALALGPPALDREFGTVDFFLLLDLETLEPRLRGLFFEGLPLPPAGRS